jgi:hypothetical protein
MTEKRTWSYADPCVWDGEQTTLGAVSRKYRGTAYERTVIRAIAKGGATNHAELLVWDMQTAARMRRGGTEAAKKHGCRIQVSPKSSRTQGWRE